jgi:thiamine-monophosphate kinase
MEFVPRIAEARTLALNGRVNAMIDLSDGLSRDLAQICVASNVGAVIDAAAIPVHEDAIEMRRDGHSPLEHALHDGEDHELLFTSISAPTGIATRIGVITAERGILIEKDGVSTPLEPKGWEHTF